MTMTQQDFYKLPEVVAATEAQMYNAFGSEAHYKGYSDILEIAKKMGLDHQFDTKEQRDKDYWG